MNFVKLSGVILENNGDWFDRNTKSWLYDHWEKQAAKGNGLPSQQVTADSPSVGTIKKRYFAGQGDNPVVCHPTNLISSPASVLESPTK